MLPRDLPKACDQTLRNLDNRTSPINSLAGQDGRPGLDILALHLSQAEFYWVKADMVALAVAAGEQLLETAWDITVRPSAAGLIYFQGGVGMTDAGLGPLPIDAAVWGTIAGRCHVWLMVDRRRLAKVAEMLPEAAVGMLSHADALGRMPPLVPVSALWRPLDEITRRGDTDPLMFTLNAAWLLMQQPTLLDRTRERPERSQRQAYARAGRPVPEISVIDLRRAYVPQDRDPDAGSDGRTYRNRWVVSGHWRNQAYGPEHSQRRRQWIPSYVKGPDGAPLLVTEKVNVWRR
jgi:hypothetical protein